MWVMYALVHNYVLWLPVLYCLGLLCVYIYIDTCNGPCALSCIKKWHNKMYIIIIIIIRSVRRPVHTQLKPGPLLLYYYSVYLCVTGWLNW